MCYCRCARNRLRPPHIRARAFGTADARADARPAGDTDDARQGNRQFVARLERLSAAFAKVAVKGKMNGRCGQLQTRTRSPIRTSTGSVRGEGRDVARSRVQSVHDADRAARLHWPSIAIALARTNTVADRFRSRRLGLHFRSAISGSGRRRARSDRRRCRTK